ncbi:hypothetical protein NL676_035768 [Syzygium grande]|nr:hypothetical protein NL676_035768 [Syzygium grande]
MESAKSAGFTCKKTQRSQQDCQCGSRSLLQTTQTVMGSGRVAENKSGVARVTRWLVYDGLVACCPRCVEAVRICEECWCCWTCRVTGLTSSTGVLVRRNHRDRLRGDWR